MLRSTNTMVATVVLALTFVGTSRAGYVVNLSQTGGDVVAAGSGTINTVALTNQGVSGEGPGLDPAIGTALFGSSGPITYFGGVSGPDSFGGYVFAGATSGTGDLVGVEGVFDRLVLPYEYVSGSMLNSSALWSGQTLNSLGLTLGTYTWTWGSGATADFFTMNIGVSSVPEPSSLLLAGVGLGFAALVSRVRRRSTWGI
jgi:hypothetical protein